MGAERGRGSLALWSAVLVVELSRVVSALLWSQKFA